MTKEEFKADVIKLHKDWVLMLKRSEPSFVMINERAEKLAKFDPELARLTLAVITSYTNAVYDVINYVENKTECKNG